MRQAFESSCNVPFAEIGMALKADRMSAQAQAYGFCRTEPTFSAACQDETIPFVLPWEVGHFPDASYFVNNEAALARSAIGLDNDLTNPLHLALIASAIANQGTMYAPRLVTEVRDSTTGQTIRTGPDEFSHPLTADSARQLRQMMVSVVESGTGTAAQIDGTVVAARPDRDQRRGRRRTRGSPRSRGRLGRERRASP
jgi:peptidoglycan glycosyltransferase